MCLSCPISTTVTLQIDLNIIFELVILREYSNERDYEVGNMCPNSRKFVSLWLTVLVWANIIKMFHIERRPSVVHWYAVPESTVLICNHVHTQLTNHIACNLSLSCFSVDFSRTKFWTTFSSSSLPDSIPRESWKTYPSWFVKVSSSVMLCSPRYNMIRHARSAIIKVSLTDWLTSVVGSSRT